MRREKERLLATVGAHSRTRPQYVKGAPNSFHLPSSRRRLSPRNKNRNKQTNLKYMVRGGCMLFFPMYMYPRRSTQTLETIHTQEKTATTKNIQKQNKQKTMRIKRVSLRLQAHFHTHRPPKNKGRVCAKTNKNLTRNGKQTKADTTVAAWHFPLERGAGGCPPKKKKKSLLDIHTS